MTTIWAHTLVKNEERYLWFAVSSVVDYVDKMLLWDTGSTDKTIDIIKALKRKYSQKINTRFIKEINPVSFTEYRQEMLEETKSDWFIIVDGDEVWWDEGIAKITKIMKGHRDTESIVNRYYNIIGDIYHYQDEKAGKYHIDGKTGNLTIRAMKRNIKGLHFGKPHGQQGIFDGDSVLIQDRSKEKRFFIDEPAYMHFTHMIRSGNIIKDKEVIKRSIKYKYELGNVFPLDFYYPEAFLKEGYVNQICPWVKMSKRYFIKSLCIKPMKQIKRNFFNSNKSGY
jgi:glycosyltransferase involved in cell wall biosynthesis